MKTPHKHAELIKAWAGGAEIEGQDIEGNWFITFHPDWRRDGPYRIKPEPKPDLIQYYQAWENHIGLPTNVKYRTDNLKLTFDSETGALKSAEAIS